MANNDFSAIARRVPREGVYYLTTTERLAIVSPHEIAVIDTTLQKVFYAYNSVWYDSAPAGPVTGFDALAPTTTRGDVITRGASVNGRLAIGASGTVLKSNGTDPAWGYQIPNLITADLGYFIAPWGDVRAAAVTSIVAAANQTKAVQFVLPFRVTVADLITSVSTLEVGKFYGAGVYADLVSAALFATGAISTTTAVVTKTTLGSPYVLEPGVYYLAWTSDTAGTARWIGFNVGAGGAGLLQDTVNLIGQSANVGVAGALPATLGTLSTQNYGGGMMMVMKP